jgi:hypothetical protein
MNISAMYLLTYDLDIRQSGLIPGRGTDISFPHTAIKSISYPKVNGVSFPRIQPPGSES